MRQAAKVTFFTIPLSLIHLVAFLGIFASGLMLLVADMRFIENVPVLGTVQNTPAYWAVISLVLAIIAFFTNPSLYMSRASTGVSDGIACIVGSFSGLLMPIVLAIAVFSSPFFILVALGEGLIYLTAHLALAVYFLLWAAFPRLR